MIAPNGANNDALNSFSRISTTTSRTHARSHDSALVGGCSSSRISPPSGGDNPCRAGVVCPAHLLPLTNARAATASTVSAGTR